MQNSFEEAKIVPIIFPVKYINLKLESLDQ